MRPHGSFNAKKCVEYLRHVGVEVSDEQAQSWEDSQSVHRFLASTRKASRVGNTYHCVNGHGWYGTLWEDGKGMKAHNAGIVNCPECGEGASIIHLRWIRAKDGTFRDFRPKAEQWRPLE